MGLIIDTAIEAERCIVIENPIPPAAFGTDEQHTEYIGQKSPPVSCSQAQWKPWCHLESFV